MAENKSTIKSIFISYERGEEKLALFVQQLKLDLKDGGFTAVWVDQETAETSEWQGVIAKELQGCAFFIPVVTQKYAMSQYCMNELCTANGAQKMIFPVMYDDPQHINFESTENGRSLKFIVSGINWTMFRPGVDDYKKSLSKLITGLKDKVKECECKDSEATAPVVGPSSSTPIKVITGIRYPAQLATGLNGEIVVASFMGQKVHVYDRNYELVRTIGSQGIQEGQFMCPHGIAIDDENRIYVGSSMKVDVYSMDGKLLNSKGSIGNGPLQFTNAVGIAIGKEGEIFVLELVNNRVQLLTSDLEYCDSFSKVSSSFATGCLSHPQAIAINSEGNVYVADTKNQAVQVFDPKGKFLFDFGEFGPTNKLVPGTIRTPMAITIDGDDNVYVGNVVGTIPIFDKSGKFLNEFGTYSASAGQFRSITGLHIDCDGRLYVCEGHSNRIEIFEGCAPVKKTISS